MSKIDNKRKFISVNIAVLTISDSRTLENDSSGDLLSKKIKKIGHNLYDRKIIIDDVKKIKKTILSWSKNLDIDAIITTGGTGLTGRDSTPEAIESIAHKIIAGFVAPTNKIRSLTRR